MSKEKRNLTETEYAWLNKLEKIIADTPPDLLGVFSDERGVILFDLSEIKNIKTSQINNALAIGELLSSDCVNVLYESGSEASKHSRIEFISQFIVEKMKTGGALTNPGMGWRLSYQEDADCHKELLDIDDVVMRLSQAGLVDMSMRHATIIATLKK